MKQVSHNDQKRQFFSGINLLRAIQTEVLIKSKNHVSSDCSETNCSTYCSDHQDADH